MVNRQCECRKVHHVCIALHCIYYGDDYFRFFRQLWLRACVRVCVSMCHCRALALTLVRREHKHTLRLASSIILFTRSTRDSSFRSVCSGWQFDVQQRWQTHCRCTVNSNACHMMNVQERVNFWFLSVFSSVSFFFFSFVIFTILIIINRYFSLDACDYTRREYFCFTSFDSKIWYFCLIPSFGSWILNKRNAGIVYFYSSFSCAEPDHHFSFFMEKKVSTFQIISTFKRNAMEKKLKAHTHSHSHTVNMIRIDVGVCLMCKNALPWKTTTATTTTMERNAHIAFFESNMRRIAHLSEFAVYRKLLHFK